MYKLQIKSTYTGFKSFGNFDCLAFKNQTVTFQKINLLRILRTRVFQFTHVDKLLQYKKAKSRGLRIPLDGLCLTLYQFKNRKQNQTPKEIKRSF